MAPLWPTGSRSCAASHSRAARSRATSRCGSTSTWWPTAAGRWSFAVTLNQGENVLSFRVGDDLSTARTLTLYYQP